MTVHGLLLSLIIVTTTLVIHGQSLQASPISRQTLRDFCQLPPEVGPCKAFLIRTYFDPLTGSCQNFNYGGCGGNKNRFLSPSSCYETCSAHRLTVKRLKMLSGTRIYGVEKETAKKEPTRKPIAIVRLEGRPSLVNLIPRTIVQTAVTDHNVGLAAIAPPAFDPRDFKPLPNQETIAYA